MATDAASDFRKTLVQAVKDAAQDIANNAEDYVGNTDLLSHMTITIDFDPDFDMKCPTITVDKDYVCKTAVDRFIRGVLE